MEMNVPDKFHKNGYIFLENFLSIETSKLIVESSIFTGLKKNLCKYQNIPSHVIYGSPHGDALLKMSKQLIDKNIYPVLPTYSFFRIYHRGAILSAHKDRKECEISMTIALSQNDWTFDVVSKEGQKNKYKMNMGDAILYEGCNVLHGRESALEEENSAHIFLHYVKSNGNYTDLIYDGREGLGIPKQ